MSAADLQRGSYQDLSVAAYKLLQRLHHLLPVLRLLEVGVARPIRFLETEDDIFIYFFYSWLGGLTAPLRKRAFEDD